MRITHNIASLQTVNQLQRTNKSHDKAVERLSSGMRINRSADDAANASISQKMRAQIRGLDKAQQNIQEGMSLIQTAEGALEAITAPLQRMRELAVQAANGTLTDSDRQKLQDELAAARATIDDIANNTHFNGIPLMNVPATVKQIQQIPSYTPNTSETFTVNAGQTKNVGYVNVLPGAPPNTLTITAAFVPESGNDYPDLHLISPTGEKFGYTEILSGFGATSKTGGMTSATQASYSGYGGNNETFTFQNPAVGQWQVVINNSGSSSSTFTLTSNQDIVVAGGVPSVTWTTQEIEVPAPKFKLHLGANEGSGMEFRLSDVRVETLQIDHVAIDTQEDAERAITVLDNALQKVTAERSRYGAYSNGLDTVYQNASVYHSNITSAESRITDADMAQESMQWVKSQILAQAGQSMLGQANAIPEGTLSLLRG